MGKLRGCVREVENESWRMRLYRSIFAIVLLVAFACGSAICRAEDGHEGWLRYAPLDREVATRYAAVPKMVVVYGGGSVVLQSAGEELVRGVRGMLGVTLSEGAPNRSNGPAACAGHSGGARHGCGKTRERARTWDGRLLAQVGIVSRLAVAFDCGADDRGVLYGVFALPGRSRTREWIANFDDVQSPFAPVRWVNQWDNLDGTIERGYGGRSIFWEDGHVRDDLTRVSDYGRLLASIGINGCAINNVNADPRVLSPEFMPQIAQSRMPFGRGACGRDLGDFGSPKSMGGLDTFDPLDAKVAAWWKANGRRDLRGDARSGRLCFEGRFGRAAWGRRPMDARMRMRPTWWRAR